MRRPKSLSECVRISNSMHSPTPFACSISKPACKSSMERSVEEHISQLICFCCGRRGHKPKDKKCPARLVTCHNCGKKGHFASVCKSSKSTGNSHVQVNTVVFAAQAKDASLPEVLRNRVLRPVIKVRIAASQKRWSSSSTQVLKFL